MYCYSCGARIDAENVNYCYNCSAKSICKFNEEDFNELWRESDVFYKNAKQLYVSKNRYRYIFVFAALSIISIAMLTVLISDMFVYVQTANNMLKITNTPTALIEQAFMDIWCALALIIVSSIALFISVCFLCAMFRVKRHQK